LSVGLREKVYERLPVSFQNAACWLYGKEQAKLRFAGDFQRRLEWLTESEKWAVGEIEAYQNEMLCALVRHAYANVPYYHELLDRLHLHPSDIRTVDDLVKLPVLTKEDLRSKPDAFISRKTSTKSLVRRKTSGTSGKSLEFYHSRSAIQFQWAVWWRHRRRFGLELEDWHANFTGKLVVPPRQQRPPYWRWSSPLKQAILNMQHLVPEKVESITDFLNQHPFAFYSGYPSVIHAFVLSAMERETKLTSPPRVVVTGAENLLDFQRRDIQSFTGAIMTDQYGFTEGCGNASQCSEFVYHEDFEFGIMECHDPVSIEDGKVKGKILCTGFACPEFPFIRYEVGDIGVWADRAHQCACGRQSKVLKSIDGRIDDYVLTPEGLRVMRFDYIFKDTKNVKECQVVQERPGEINVLIVRRPEYSLTDERFITDEIHRWISVGLKVSYVYVNEIEREGNGKFKAVKSLLSRPAA
jgi:phenylacetate-CoA ligase